MNGKEYVASPIEGNWLKQKTYCENNGMILATFDNKQDIEKIYNTCKATYCYLGFHDLDGNSQFEFVDDGEIVDNEASGSWFFKTARPNHQCGAIVPVYHLPRVLFNTPCDHQRGIKGVCEKINIVSKPICNGMYMMYMCTI